MASPKKAPKEAVRKTSDDEAKLDRLRELVSILEGSTTLTELEYEDADIIVRLTRSAPAKASWVARIHDASAATGASPEGDVAVVKAPVAGIFHRGSQSSGAPLAEVGSAVGRAEVLCLIEAMQVHNEVRSEVAGTVVEVMREDGAPVEVGDPLFRVAVRSGPAP